MKRLFATTALILCLVARAFAQDHSGHDMPAETATPAQAGTPAQIVAPATDAAGGYQAAMDKMMATTMSNKPSGDADVDFVRGMIPHHQAAIDMAKVQLQFGKDAEIRKLSEEIIAAQQREIVQMLDWLDKNAPK